MIPLGWRGGTHCKVRVSVVVEVMVRLIGGEAAERIVNKQLAGVVA